ncbi:uncharacterized protein N7500_000646 [Penicillium coprophilum]|uniref:uncharacterized protein n=1 Tax=Penicillium coprophilum TaxID=36646 RepID=UPI002396C4CF|nr:uncharacterized protein N7500_000646 [Penicillium coprophilum]KAJ5177947.1 hypothetical protein N7500_000646 [Penicillium coprophilum]
MSAFAPEDSDNDYSYAEVDRAETSTPPIPQSMGDADASHGRGHSNNPLLGDNPPSIRFGAGSAGRLSDKLADLAGSPASMPLDGLRLLERKTATVCTLLKASVYSIVLQQQIWNENEEQQQQEQNEDRHFQDHQYQYEGEGDVTFQ